MLLSPAAPAGTDTPPPLAHVLAKPTGARCNLDCTYCFYLKKEALYAGSRFRMSDEVADTLVDQLLEMYRGERVVPLAWQGGEPTLMGLPFFRRMTARARAGLGPGQRLEHTLQTNGVLLDDEWCTFFAQEDVLVGLSIDGPRELHDTYRVDTRGLGTFEQVVAAATRLRAHGVRTNALVTVNAVNAPHPLRVYRFLRDNLGFAHIQLIPIVDVRDGRVAEHSVGAAEWGRFLVAIFDEWVRRDVGQVFVPQFDAALAAWLGQEPAMCVFRETCGGAVALEHNGDLYACDHFVEPAFLLGNVRDASLSTLVGSTAQRAFGDAKRDSLPAKCRTCPVLFACRGECPKNRLRREPDGALNQLCEGYLAFFTHIDHPMKIMAGLLRDGRPVPAVRALLAAEAQPLDRHAPCPCESGRKYRHCHGASTG